jgi:hypothetical protein
MFKLRIVLRLLAQADFWQVKRWPALNKPDVMTLAIINFSTTTQLFQVCYHFKILFHSLGLLTLVYGRCGVGHLPHGNTVVVSYTIWRKSNFYSSNNKKKTVCFQWRSLSTYFFIIMYILWGRGQNTGKYVRCRNTINSVVSQCTFEKFGIMKERWYYVCMLFDYPRVNCATTVPYWSPWPSPSRPTEKWPCL